MITAAGGIQVAARGLTFSYSADAPPVVDGLSVDLPGGAICALTGPSGSGKSTLLYLLALMIRPTEGSVIWQGQAVSALPDARRSQLRASRVGFVFQDALLDPARTVLANVCDGGMFAGMRHHEAVDRARVLLERFGVSHRGDHRPGEISGGQAQRVALCRALLADPPIVFADEPTGNLDDASADLVWQALADHAATGACVIVATHDRSLAARAAFEVNLEVGGRALVRRGHEAPMRNAADALAGCVEPGAEGDHR